jgi:hypothetical protein
MGAARVADERRSSRSRLATIDRWLLMLVLCAPLLGLIGVVAAELVPDERIADQLVDAQTSELIGPDDPSPTPLGTTPARFTECTTFSLGLGDWPRESTVANSVLSPTYIGCTALGAALAEYTETATLRPGYRYLHYWHGYAVFTRPTSALIGVAGVRWIAFACSLVAAAALCFVVRRLFGAVAALLIVVPPLLTSDMVVAGLSTHVAIGSACAWLAGLIALRAVAAQPRWWTAAIAGAVAGVMSAYLDLMTTMPGTLALTAVGATLGACAANRDAVPHAAWRIAAAAVIGWVVGLAWMWGSKWVIAAAVHGIDQVEMIVRSEIAFRVSSGTNGVTRSRADGLTKNFVVWWDQPLTPWVIVGTLAALAVLAATTVLGHRRSRVQWGLALCAVIATVPVLVWYPALNNHSQIHSALVYRSLPIAFGACTLLLYAALRRPVGSPKRGA